MANCCANEHLLRFTVGNTSISSENFLSTSPDKLRRNFQESQRSSKETHKGMENSFTAKILLHQISQEIFPGMILESSKRMMMFSILQLHHIFPPMTLLMSLVQNLECFLETSQMTCKLRLSL